MSKALTFAKQMGHRRAWVRSPLDMLEYDHLSCGLGSITNFFNLPGRLSGAPDHEVVRRRDSVAEYGSSAHLEKATTDMRQGGSSSNRCLLRGRGGRI